MEAWSTREDLVPGLLLLVADILLSTKDMDTARTCALESPAPAKYKQASIWYIQVGYQEAWPGRIPVARLECCCLQDDSPSFNNHTWFIGRTPELCISRMSNDLYFVYFAYPHVAGAL